MDARRQIAASIGGLRQSEGLQLELQRSHGPDSDPLLLRPLKSASNFGLVYGHKVGLMLKSPSMNFGLVYGHKVGLGWYMR